MLSHVALIAHHDQSTAQLEAIASLRRLQNVPSDPILKKVSKAFRIEIIEAELKLGRSCDISPVSDEMSAASASAYSWSESEELITVGNADDIYNEMVDTRTAILDESEEERFDESDLSTAILDDDEDLITAVSHDYSAYSLPASETFVDMDDIEPNSVKTAEMEVSAYTPPPSETDVDMEPESLQNHSEDVVGGASPMSTAVTGSISWYSMPPSETNVELPTSMGGDRSKFVEAVEDIEGHANEGLLRCQDYLEGLALNESAVGSELNKAFLEAEETDKERTDGDKDPYDFDTAIEA